MHTTARGASDTRGWCGYATLVQVEVGADAVRYRSGREEEEEHLVVAVDTWGRVSSTTCIRSVTTSPMAAASHAAGKRVHEAPPMEPTTPVAVATRGFVVPDGAHGPAPASITLPDATTTSPRTWLVWWAPRCGLPRPVMVVVPLTLPPVVVVVVVR